MALIASLIIIVLLIIGSGKGESIKSLSIISGVIIVSYFLAAIIQPFLEKVPVLKEFKSYLWISVLGSAFIIIFGHIYRIFFGIATNSKPPEMVFQGLIIVIALSLITIPFTALRYYAPQLLKRVKFLLTSNKNHSRTAE